MGVPMGDDPMLNYQCGAFHDGAALRQTHGCGRRPSSTPGHRRWASWMPRAGWRSAAGDLSIFLGK